MKTIICGFLSLTLALPQARIPGPGGKSSGLAGTPISQIQVVKGATSNDNNLSIAYSSNNTPGGISVACAAWITTSGTATLSSVTDSSGNTYAVDSPSQQTTAGSSGVANISTGCAYATAIVAGANTVTFNFSGTISAGAIIYELTAGARDQSSGAVGNSATPSAGSVTTTGSGAYLVALCYLQDGFGFGSGWFTSGAGFTLDQQWGGGAMDGASEVFAQTSSGTATGAFGSNFSGTTGPWTASIIAFKP